MEKSAGILPYRLSSRQVEILLLHPGGPFWKNKDAGAWSIPKGEFTADENAMDAAKREFKEETGFDCNGELLQLTPVKMKSGKMVYAWAMETAIDAALIKSNEFEMAWPPKSGKLQRFPEVDRAEWFDVMAAKEKANSAFVALIDELLALLKHRK